jgi:hypothetical protein
MIGSLIPTSAALAAGSTSTYMQAPQLLYPVDTVLDSPNPPVFHWTGVPGAISYTLQVATDPQFSTIVASVSTSNTRFTPITLFANGTYYWRMKVQGANGQLSLYVSATFAVNWSAAPALVAPKSGQTLFWGKDSFIFSWRALTFAATYNLQVSTSPNFSSTIFTGSTPNTSLAVPGVTLTNGVIYYWRVQGVDVASQPSAWPAPWSFVKQWHPVPTIFYPETLSATRSAPLTDPVLRWGRIDGAAKYEVQISTDFLALQGANSDQPAPASVADDETTPLTYLVPKLGALPSANYIWHVRGIDSQGNPGPWSPWAAAMPGPYRFTVAVPAAVTPSMPADGATITKPLLQWSAVRYAGYYEVQTAPNVNFRPEDTSTFLTYTNALAPGLWSPAPAINAVLYWRVRAVTGAGIVGQWSTQTTGHPWSFVFSSGGPVVAISPLNGKYVQTPVLTWSRLPNAAQYQIVIHDGVTNQFATYTTQNTTFTPPDATLINDCATQSCYWYVRAVLADGNTEPTPDPSTFGSFTNAALSTLPVYQVPVPVSPLPGSAASVAMPSFCWQAATGASKYQLFYSPGADTFQPLGTDQTSATCQTPTFNLPDGTYKWFVRALDANGGVVSDGPISEFTIQSGLAINDGVNGCALLPSDYLAPQVVKASLYQPIFSWNPVPCATAYHIYVSTNPFFASAIKTPPDTASVPNVIDDVDNYPYTVYLAPTVTAGATRYYPVNGTLYLLVRPIVAKQQDGTPIELPPSTKGIFNGERIAVTVPDLHLVSPANGATVGDTPLLHYQRYLQGVQYEVQIGSAPDLSTGIKIDATTYSGAFAPSTDLADGTWYWRVRAIVSNIYYTPPLQLRWSTIWHFTKTSPAPALYRPAADQVVDFTPVFTWQPIQRAAQYEIQVSNNDPAFLGTLLDTAKVDVPAYVPKSLYPVTARNAYLYWRVRLIDTSGNAGPWSANGRFQLRFKYPVGISPPPDETLGSPYPVFSYQPLLGAASYQLELSTISDFSSVSQTISTQGTNWTPTAPFGSGTYYWRVKPVDALGGVGTPSVARSFTVPTPAAAPTSTTSTTPMTPTTTTSTQSVRITSAATTTPQGKPATTFPAGVKEVNFQFSWINARPNADTFQVLIYKSDGTEAGAGQVVKFPSPSGTEYRIAYYYDVQTKERVTFPSGTYRLAIDVDGKPMRDLTFTVK